MKEARGGGEYMWETERTRELMRRWTAVNHDPKYTQKQAMTQNIGMCMCTATKETGHFPGKCTAGRNPNQVMFEILK